MIYRLLLSFSLIGLISCSNSKFEQPNVIILLIDDQGYGDVGKHGNPVLKTPSTDRLYEESARFTNFVVSATCAPTRCALMTGKHEFLSGVAHFWIGSSNC